jgi:hypothetical protein
MCKTTTFPASWTGSAALLAMFPQYGHNTGLHDAHNTGWITTTGYGFHVIGDTRSRPSAHQYAHTDASVPRQPLQLNNLQHATQHSSRRPEPCARWRSEPSNNDRHVELHTTQHSAQQHGVIEQPPLLNTAPSAGSILQRKYFLLSSHRASARAILRIMQRLRTKAPSQVLRK